MDGYDQTSICAHLIVCLSGSSYGVNANKISDEVSTFCGHMWYIKDKSKKSKQNSRVADKQLGNIIKNVPELRVCNSGKWLCFLHISNIGWGPSKSFKCIHTLAMRPTLHKLNQSFQACDSSDAIQRLSSPGISCIKTCAPAEFL